MPRNDKQIAAYMKYYVGTPDRQWALENLCRVEGKTEEEIRAACAAYGVNIPESRRKISYETKEKVAEAIKSGMKTNQIKKAFDVTSGTVRNIQKKLEAGKPITKPPAVPPQEGPETAKKSDAEKIPYKKPEIIPAPEPVNKPAEKLIDTLLDGSRQAKSVRILPACPASSVWLAIRDELKEVALGMFGAGVEVVEEFVNVEAGAAHIEIRTADGEPIRLSVGKVEKWNI